MKTTSVYTGVAFRDRQGQLRVSDQKVTFKPDAAPEDGKVNKDSWKWGAVKKHLVSSRSNQKALLKLVSREDTSKSLVFALRNHDELDTICMDVTERLRASRRREEEAGDDASITLDDTTHSVTTGDFMASSRRSSSTTRRGSNRRGSDVTFSSIHIADDNLPNLDDSTTSRGSATSRRRSSAKDKLTTKISGNSYMTGVGSKQADQQRGSFGPLSLFMVLVMIVVASGAAAIRAGHLKNVVAKSPFLQDVFFSGQSNTMAAATKERKRGFFQNKKESQETSLGKYCLWTTEPTSKGTEECIFMLPFADRM